MATATRIRLTPKDHGREIDPGQFDAAAGKEGYHYELIDGRVYVSPVADMPAGYLEAWLVRKLLGYSAARPEVLGFVHTKTRVFVPGRAKRTCPEPDIAGYADVPRKVALKHLRWQDFNPLLVVEVVSADDPKKDYVRNVELYAEVPSIREYWVLDPRPDPDRPSLRVYRRRGKTWQKPIDVPFGGTYQSTRILPGFTLVVDPDRA